MCCYSSLQIHFFRTNLWVLPPATEAECFTVTEVNADFLDDPLRSVAFSRAVLKKVAHLRSWDSQQYYGASAI